MCDGEGLCSSGLFHLPSQPASQPASTPTSLPTSQPPSQPPGHPATQPPADSTCKTPKPPTPTPTRPPPTTTRPLPTAQVPRGQAVDQLHGERLHPGVPHQALLRPAQALLVAHQPVRPPGERARQRAGEEPLGPQAGGGAGRQGGLGWAAGQGWAGLLAGLGWAAGWAAAAACLALGVHLGSSASRSCCLQAHARSQPLSPLSPRRWRPR
jgi:hypothetical protein